MKMKHSLAMCSTIIALLVALLYVPNVIAEEGPPPGNPPHVEGTGNPQGPPPPPNNQPEDFMAKWDKNKDGRVTRREYKGPAEEFARLDKNHDRVVDRSEAASPPPPPGNGTGAGQPGGDQPNGGQPGPH
jgi:hypothetical protein